MNVRNHLLSLLSVMALPAVATSGFTAVGGEAGVTTHAMPAALTRAQVQQDLAAWKRNLVTADGWRQVGPEAGWVYEGTPGKLTRQQVRDELAQWRRNPVTADGWMDVGGQAGWVFVGRPAGQSASATLGGRRSEAAPAQQPPIGSARALGRSVHSGIALRGHP